jgi:NADPH-dependent curcumin reductase CurA
MSAVNTMPVARCWTLAHRPEGRPVAPDDFALAERPLPPLEEGQILARTAYLSVAPVMRLYMLNATPIEPPLALGDVMHGRGVGTVLASRHPQFVPGDVVQGRFGWRDHAILSGDAAALTFKVRQRVAPISTALGPLGMTGWTAYVGLSRIGALKPGDTVVISGAAGGVGSIAGPVAANLGAPAIGIAGTDEKCQLLVERLGYCAAINYRTQDVTAELKRLCPQGIDLMFDNVGGPILDAALANLARYARVVLCGRISQYLLGAEETYALRHWGELGRNRARMEAFFIYDHADLFSEAEDRMAQWIAAGTLPLAEDILDGLERMPEALISLFEGTNTGKRLVRVDPEADRGWR